MLYPLSYEGLRWSTPWSSSLFLLLLHGEDFARFGIGPHLGRTVTSIHRICEVLEVVLIEGVPVQGDLSGMSEHSQAFSGQPLRSLPLILPANAAVCRRS